MLQSDVDETTSVIMTTIVSCATADGETAQQMSVVESQGGGSRGETLVHSEYAVRVQATISGADATAGMMGMGQ